MDWNALGTWAAVVAALAIALSEGWTRRRDRKAAHLLMSARILPSCIRLDSVLRDTLAQSETIDAMTVDASLLLDACVSFAQKLDGNGLGRFRGVADQSAALPPDMLVPLFKVLMLEEMLLENYTINASKELSHAQAVEEFEHWIEQMRAMRASLHWIIEGAQRKMSSWRWRHPEVGSSPRWG